MKLHEYKKETWMNSSVTRVKRFSMTQNPGARKGKIGKLEFIKILSKTFARQKTPTNPQSQKKYKTWRKYGLYIIDKRLIYLM